MLQITSPINGAILNHNHGIETEKSLKIKVTGISQAGTPVMVNGVMATMDGLNFSADVELTQKVNKIRASAYSVNGMYTQEVTVLWDKNSYKRYSFFIDDHSFLFTDLAKERPARAFDHFYLAGLKKIHEESGLKVTLNCFFHNDHFDCDMTQVPDCWKSEFVDNSDWMKLSFHSLGEFPDRLYIEASEEEFAHDYDLVHDQIVRFAGEETFIAPAVIHWGNISPGAAKAFIDRGGRVYNGMFRARYMGGPSLADRAAGTKTNNIAKSQDGCGAPTREGAASMFGFGFDEHFNRIDEVSFAANHRAYYDPNLGVVFTRGCCCCNLVPIEKIPGRYAQAFAEAEISGNEFFAGGSHEQYTFPYYHNYIPDHMQRIECAAKCLYEGGCTPVFYSEGFMGNMSWGK